MQRIYIPIEKQPRDDREEYADTANDEQTVGIRENKGLLTKSQCHVADSSLRGGADRKTQPRKERLRAMAISL